MSALGAWLRFGTTARAEGTCRGIRQISSQLSNGAAGSAMSKAVPSAKPPPRLGMRPPARPVFGQPYKQGSALLFSMGWSTGLSSIPVSLGPGQYIVPVGGLADGNLRGEWPQGPPPAMAKGARSMTTTKKESKGESEETSIKLNSGAASIPHPDKVEKGGEDSHFVAEGGKWIGVADGVGGWAELGIDAGEYARTLMRFSDEESTRPENGTDPLKVLEKAFRRVFVQGSCTACILTVHENSLRVANVGDSGFLVVRAGKVLFRSQSQQHDFNFPYQLGGEGSDSPQDAQCYQIRVQKGDAVVAGTDGLFDNVHDRDVALVAARAVKQGLAPEACAMQLASLAAALAQDGNSVSPFAKQAREAGYAYRGGKADDVTVVVSFIE
eukprot:CAMPEP_0198204288 /NCGR_PEP_ID=MMETSP1445-20131203/7694_1 /TAXON_ID=36898 /ORGANISM="Pyramimonas sp., Strain CCMP2087" /LENGTH=382 /DNA_ID=CAMNT_0043876093 /DNA_START=327 /DNA_END=1475 /DNA_ORIENTATION=-